MLDAQLAAQHVKFMISTGLALPRSKQLIHEFHYVVGRQLDDFDLTDFVQRILETAGSGGRIVVIDFHELSARVLVDGYQQIGSAGFMGHLEPEFAIIMHEAWYVALERLERLFFGGGFECLQIADEVAPQTPV